MQPKLNVRRLLRYVCVDVSLGSHRRAEWVRYGGMIVCKGVINAHILEVPSNMRIKEALNLLEVELRIDENGSDV